MTMDEILAIKEGLMNAQTDEPILYQEQDALKVVGDANETQVKKHSYKLVFESDEGKTITQEFNDIHITPRKRVNVTRLLVKMMPYFTAANENGEVRELSNYELARTVVGMEKEIYDIAYDLAEEVLGVPSELKEYITPVSAIVFAVKLINDNPAVAKEADMSFG